ncbi:hypothetical protein [Shewanella algae]|uniref:hypothetical protein n=1 Tax=Shewanella algae TaxID=38313 RepID=UPI0031F4C0BB
MAERMTQAQALLAVLASGVRRKRRYWVTDALRSSLYPVPDTDGLAADSLFSASASTPIAVYDSTTAEKLSLSSISLRTTQIKLEVETEATQATQIGLNGVELRNTIINLDANDPEHLAAASLQLNTIVLRRVLIKHDDVEDHRLAASTLQIDSIILS